MILYEYPLNERVRTLLRLEDLFDRLDFFARREHSLDHHVALTTLFDILDISARADVKSDLLQELDRQRQALTQFRSSPDVSLEALDRILAQIDEAWASLNATTGKTGQHLRDNEWLMSIRNRAAIPGGVCEFDLPSYHHWLNRDSAFRQRDLQGWLAPMLPIRQGIGIVLRLLRASGRPEPQVAVRGSYQLMLAGRTAQLVRLRLRRAESAVPEISANKYALNIRFTMPDTDLRPKQSDTDIPFELTFCNL